MAIDPQMRSALNKRLTEVTGDVVVPRLNQLPTTSPYAVDDFGNTLRGDDNRVLRDRYPEYTQGLKDDEGNFLYRQTSPTVQSGNNLAADEINTTNLRPVANLDIPTSSSNVSRPRTLAAGYYLYVGERAKPYDDRRGKVTVMFRDGTLYNYYDVPPGVWQQFRNSISKGPMLNRRNKNQGSDGILLSFAHGPADLSDVPEELQRYIYRVARSAQISSQVTRRRSVQVGDRTIRTGKERFDSKKRSGTQFGYVPTSSQKNVKYSKGKISTNTTRGKNPHQK